MEFTKKVLGGRVSVERIVSGRGIVNVYEFLYARELTAAKAKGESLSAAVQAVHKEVIAESAEGGKIVGAHEHDDALCAMEWGDQLKTGKTKDKDNGSDNKISLK